MRYYTRKLRGREKEKGIHTKMWEVEIGVRGSRNWGQAWLIAYFLILTITKKKVNHILKKERLKNKDCKGDLLN